ncbi:MAG: hypothetical protein LQ339_006870 [Xanthoria mediterranea]|nr:MAG: hypothetical protein LQ339_006870 [Xanthoria mediterranea]
MPSLRDPSGSIDEGGANDSSGLVEDTHPTNTSHSFTQEDLPTAETGAGPSGGNAARRRASEVCSHSSGLAGQTATVLGPVIPAMIQPLNGIDRHVKEHNPEFSHLDDCFKDFSADADKITDHHASSTPRLCARANRRGSSHSLSGISHSANTDENNLPEGLAAQIAYLDKRIDGLETNFRPNSRFRTHIDGLITHINRVTTYSNITSANTDLRFAILTNAHTQHFGQLVARQTELEQRTDRSIEHQTTRFMDQLEDRAADVHAKIDVTNQVLDQLMTMFNRLHVDDLSTQVQINRDALQELSNRLTHISEDVHQELDTIRAAAAPMSAQTSPQAPLETPPQDSNPSPVVKGEIGFTIRGAATRQAKPTPSILDSPVLAEPVSTITTPSTPPAITTQLKRHRPPRNPLTTPAKLEQESLALVMRNNIGLSKVMTSEDSYWAPRNVARRAADYQAAAAAVQTSLTDEQRSHLFRERLVKAGVRIAAPTQPRSPREDDDAQAYGSLDRFEQLLEEKSRCVSRAGTEGMLLLPPLSVRGNGMWDFPC